MYFEVNATLMNLEFEDLVNQSHPSGYSNEMFQPLSYATKANHDISHVLSSTHVLGQILGFLAQCIG
jgi:hypothetical protein